MTIGMPKSHSLSATFWLVFGEGQSIDDASQQVEMAPREDVLRWSELGTTSWHNFERIIEDDTGELLEKYATKFTWWDRLKWRFPSIKISIR